MKNPLSISIPIWWPLSVLFGGAILLYLGSYATKACFPDLF